MKWILSRYSFGIALILAGALFLLQNLGLIPDSSWIWIGAFGAVGLYFLLIFLTSAEQWWAAFPAFGALGIAGTIAVESLTALPDELAGAVFLGSGALAFLAIYARTREHWWPVLVGGIMLTIMAVVISTTYSFNLGEIQPAVFFLGLALTFLVISFIPGETGRPRWALWPALGCLVVAGITGVAVFDLANYVLPVILIIAGALLLTRSSRRRSSEL